MADQSSTYSRIYDLKAVGADKVVSQINSITAAFEKLAAIKKGVSFDDLANGVNENASAVSAGLTKIQGSYEQTATAAEKAQKREEAARQRQMRKLDEASAKEALEIEKHIQILEKKQEALEKQTAKEEAALKRLENDYELLKMAYKDAADKAKMLGATFGTNSDVFKRASYEANRMHESLLKLEKSVGQSQRNVGNYNGAIMAMSQILREAPSFAYSTATGLLAVSNNIPILADAIKDLNEKNNLLRANGQKTIPVWKSLMEAITSPTGLITTVTAVVTILAARIAMAGNESENAKEKVNNFEQALKSLKETIQSMSFNISAGIDEEVNKAQRLVDVYHSAEATTKGRINAYNDLQSLYPKILGSLSDEEIQSKKVSAAHEAQMQKLKEVISLKVKLNEVDKSIAANIKVIAVARDEMAKMDAEMSAETRRAIDRGIKAQGDRLNHPTISDPAAGVDEEAANKYLDFRDQVLKSEKAIGIYKGIQLEQAVKLANIENNPDRNKGRDKKERDYTNEILLSRKSLIDALAEIETIEIQMEATKLKTIYEAEESSYAERLAAYEAYMGKQRELLRVETQKQVDEIDSKLGEIAKIKGLPEDKRTPEQKTLLLSEDALLSQRNVVFKKWEQERLNQTIVTEKGITNLKKEEVQKRLDQVKNLNENEQIQEDAALQNLKGQLDDGAITFDAYTKKKQAIEDSFQKKRLTNLKAYLEAEREGLRAIGADTSALDDAIGSVNHQLNELALNASERNAKKTQAIFKQATDQMFSFAQAAGQAYFDLLSKQDAAQDNREQKQMERSRQKLNASAQSLKERENYEKAFDMAQEQREKQKAEQSKKRAEAEMIYQYSIAVMKAIAAHVGDFGIGAAIEIGGMSAIFAAQLAMLEAAPAYAQGTGNHPGGMAWVGDGGEHEFARINNSWFVTPNTPTLTNLPAGSEVVPFSKVTNYSGTMGSQLQAPSFYSSSTGRGGGGVDSNIQALTGMVGQLMSGMANMRVTLDTQQAGRAINNGYYKKTHL